MEPYHGIFTEQARGVSSYCCWIGPHAVFDLPKTAGQTRLHLWTYVPDVPIFRKRAQSLDVEFPPHQFRKTMRNLTPGFHDFSFVVPAAVRRAAGPTSVRLDCGIRYNPYGAVPTYGIILTSAYFE